MYRVVEVIFCLLFGYYRNGFMVFAVPNNLELFCVYFAMRFTTATVLVSGGISANVYM